MEVGARCVARERHFNNQRGKDVEDDVVPYAEELPGFEDARQKYYELRGWTKDGQVPTQVVASDRTGGD